MFGTPEHNAWAQMIQRCYNPNHFAFERYGGREIGVCKAWLKFENFLADLGRKPDPTYCLDRINNDGIYEPSNCRWATRSQSNANKDYTFARTRPRDGKGKFLTRAGMIGWPSGTMSDLVANNDIPSPTPPLDCGHVPDHDNAGMIFIGGPRAAEERHGGR